MHPSSRLLHARRRLRRTPRVPSARAATTSAVQPEPVADPTTPRLARQVVAAETPLGCLTVRRIMDRSGRPWTVCELSSGRARAAMRAGHDSELVFQCAVPGIGTEIRRSVRSLESLTDASLTAILEQDAS